MKGRIVVVLAVPSAPFGFSPLADCTNSLTIDVDDAIFYRTAIASATAILWLRCPIIPLSGPVCAPSSVNRERRVTPAKGRREMIAQNRGPP